MINFLKRAFYSQKISNKGVCSICDEEFFDNQLSLIDELAFCQKDIHTFEGNTWTLIETRKSDPENPEEALAVQNIKDKLKSAGVPSYIVVKYAEEANVIVSLFELYIPQDSKEKYTQILLLYKMSL